MTILEKYVIMPDASVMNFETGAIYFVTKNRNGQKGLVLRDDAGKSHYFLERYLLQLKREFDRNNED
tara:strand:- start:386 stop:586 length:201 start_codon:yes stop_codon:yes gene_type:complete